MSLPTVWLYNDALCSSLSPSEPQNRAKWFNDAEVTSTLGEILLFGYELKFLWRAPGQNGGSASRLEEDLTALLPAEKQR